MVFLVGVDHLIQHNGFVWPAKKRALKEFSKYLIMVSKKYKLSILAEEFSEEALRLSNAKKSTLQAVAKQMNLMHIFCDPSSMERKRFNISNKSQRENFWIDRFEIFMDKNILFLCGASHLESISGKLTVKGIDTKIISSGWGVDLQLTR